MWGAQSVPLLSLQSEGRELDHGRRVGLTEVGTVTRGSVVNLKCRERHQGPGVGHRNRMNISRTERGDIIPGNGFHAVHMPARYVGAIRARANPRKFSQLSHF